MSNYSDSRFKQLSHNNLDATLLGEVGSTAEEYRQAARAKDQGMLTDWHSAGRANQQSVVDIRKSFRHGRSEESIIERMFKPLTSLFAR